LLAPFSYVDDLFRVGNADNFHEGINADFAIWAISRRTGSSDMVAELSANLCRFEGELPLGGLPKRALDLTVASIMLVLLAPIMLIVTVLIRVFMGGPAIFAQKRIGYGGRTFVCYKFRTMVTDGDEVLRRYLGAEPGAAREWKETRKLANDPRVGPLAAFCANRALMSCRSFSMSFMGI
jgi:lipopolysaccharide/colanic/teichoic acid biosynthesis glycosyltransferase